MEVAIPALYIPALKIKRGFFLNVNLLGVGIVIPWADVTLWEQVKLTDKIVLFNTDDVVNPIGSLVNLIPQAVWNLCKTTLDNWAREYYEKHPEELK